MTRPRRSMLDEARERLKQQRGDAHEGPDPVPVHERNGTHSSGEGIDLIIPPAQDAWPVPPAPEAYHGLAGDVVRRIEPETEVDPVAILIQYLTCFGSAAGRTAFCPVGRRRHHGNLFCVLVGKTGQGGKGDAWAWINSLFGAAAPRWHEHGVMGGLSSGEGLIKWAQDVPEDAGRRVLAIEEEFGAVLRVLGREHSTLSAVLRQGYDGGRLRVATRNNPLRVDDAHISLIGHTTPDELRAELGQTDAKNGFANRILWACVKRHRLLPEGGGLVDLADLEICTGQALDFAHNTQFVGRTEAARKLWAKSYELLTAERPGILGYIATRAAPQVLRLSLLYALLDSSRQIDVPHLRAALALWHYCERSIEAIFGATTGDRLADRILDILRAVATEYGPEAWIMQTEIHGKLGRHTKGDELDRALGALHSSGLVVYEKIPTGGRPSKRWKCAKKAN